MKFEQALKEMKRGISMKLPSWGGYWCWDEEKQTIIVHTKDNQVFRYQGNAESGIYTTAKYPLANGFMQMKGIVRFWEEQQSFLLGKLLNT